MRVFYNVCNCFVVEHYNTIQHHSEDYYLISMGLGGRGLESEKRTSHWMLRYQSSLVFLLVLLAIADSSIRSHSQATQLFDLTNPNYWGFTIN